MFSSENFMPSQTFATSMTNSICPGISQTYSATAATPMPINQSYPDSINKDSSNSQYFSNNTHNMSSDTSIDITTAHPVNASTPYTPVFTELTNAPATRLNVTSPQNHINNFEPLQSSITLENDDLRPSSHSPQDMEAVSVQDSEEINSISADDEVDVIDQRNMPHGNVL